MVSCDQDLNYFILQNEDKLFQCSYPKPIHGILGKVSLLVAVGDTHKRLRNVSLSLISTIKSKPEFINDVETLALQILQSWKDKHQVRYWEEARKVLINLINLNYIHYKYNLVYFYVFVIRQIKILSQSKICKQNYNSAS